MSHRKNVYFTDRTLDLLGKSTSLSGRVATIVERYAEIVRRERPQDAFSEAERSAILDACRGWLAEPAASIFDGVAMEVADALEDGLADRWPIDGPNLVANLRALSPGAQVALVDWIESKRGS